MKIKFLGALVLSAISLSALVACTNKPAEPEGEGQKEGEKEGEGGGKPAVEKVKITYKHNYPFVGDEEGAVEEPEDKVVEVEKGKAVEVYKPVLAGYSFAGWYKSETTVFGEGVELAGGVNEDIEVYARWTLGEEFENWSIVGAFEEANWNPSYEGMEMTTQDGIHYTIESLTLNEGQEWKAIANHQWNAGEMNGSNLSEASAEYALDASGNIKTKTAGVYTVNVDLYAGKLNLTRTADGGKYAAGFDVYLLGGFNNWAREDEVDGEGQKKNPDAIGKFEPVEGAVTKGKWELNNFDVTDTAQFKVVVVTHYNDESIVNNWMGPKAGQCADILIEELITRGEGDDPNFIIEAGKYSFAVTINNPWLDDMVASAAEGEIVEL